MIEIITNKIKAHDDFELNVKRSAELTYHMAYNDKKSPDGIIFVIPGFGEDADINYQKKLLEYISIEYNMIAIFVEYHGIWNRLKNGATVNFDNIDIEVIIDIIDKYKINLDKDLSFDNILYKLSKDIPDYDGIISATYYPRKKEYQNFGILQSLDILNVLYDLKSRGFKDIISTKPIVAMGSSHGGYLSNLLVRLAPNTFDVIIDNSCYVKPPLQYIIGKEKDITKAEVILEHSNMKLNAFTATLWSTNKLSNKYFSDSAYEIRNLLNNKFLNKTINLYKSKTSYISYHSVLDKDIAPYKDKLEYYTYLTNNSCDYILNTVENESQVDGVFIKNLSHAMDISNKELLKNTLPNILKKYKKSTPTDLCNNSVITYETSEKKLYKFNFLKNNIIAELIE